MVAKVLDAMGVPFGDNLNPFRENRAMNGAIKKRDDERFQKACEEQNGQFEKWCLKSPKMRVRFNHYLPMMRNPRLIVTFRDILAISIRNEIVMQHDLLDVLQVSITGYNKMLAQIASSSAPIFLFSYEKALLNPKEFAQSLADFCGVVLTKEELEKVASLIVNGDKDYIAAAEQTQALIAEKKQSASA